MASLSTLALRELRPGLAVVVAHTGPNRAARRHMLAGPVGAQRTVTIPKAARVPASNQPHVTRVALVAPQLSRRDRRIAQRDARKTRLPIARPAAA